MNGDPLSPDLLAALRRDAECHDRWGASPVVPADVMLRLLDELKRLKERDERLEVALSDQDRSYQDAMQRIASLTTILEVERAYMAAQSDFCRRRLWLEEERTKLASRRLRSIDKRLYFFLVWLRGPSYHIKHWTTEFLKSLRRATKAALQDVKESRR